MISCVAIRAGARGPVVGQTAEYAATKEDAAQLLSAVSDTYAKASAYHFEFKVTQTTESPLARSWHRTDYEIAVDARGRERLSANEFGRHLSVVSNGIRRWIYAPTRHQYVETSARQTTDPRDPGRLLQNLVDQYIGQFRVITNRASNPAIERSELLNIGNRTVRCTVVSVSVPMPAGVATKTTRRYWIEPTTHIVWKELMETQDDLINGEVETGSHSTLEITFNVADIDRPLDDSLFVFLPPSGAVRVNLLWTMGSAVNSLAGKEALALKLPAFDGATFELSSLRGKTVVLDFWASWCAPCRAQMPGLIKLYQEYKDKGVVFVGVSEDEEADQARRFIAVENIPWINLRDLDAQAGKLWNVQSVPVLVVIDPAGKIVQWLSGDSPDALPLIRSALNR